MNVNDSHRNDFPGRRSQLGRRLTLLITNLIKLGGLVVALNEAFTRTQPRAIEIALAAFMMAGAQISEEAILGLVTRMFGGRLDEERKR